MKTEIREVRKSEIVFEEIFGDLQEHEFFFDIETKFFIISIGEGYKKLYRMPKYKPILFWYN